MKLFLNVNGGNGREGRDEGEEGGEYEKPAFFFFPVTQIRHLHS